jgi:hypothetical protein
MSASGQMQSSRYSDSTRCWSAATIAPSPGPIVETVVTTMNPDASVNCGAMGVEWSEDEIVIKPFRRTRTLRNLVAERAAVVHLTDDIGLFVESALGDPHPQTRPALSVRGAVVSDACSWREVRVCEIDTDEVRARIVTAVVARGFGREFLGFNRARGAVLEASILASRFHLLSPTLVQREFDRLQVIVDKTAGPRELAAMDFVRRYVAALRDSV